MLLRSNPISSTASAMASLSIRAGRPTRRPVGRTAGSFPVISAGRTYFRRVHVLEGRADLLRQRGQRSDVETVDGSSIASEHPACLALGDVEEGVMDALSSMRPGPLGVRKIVPPQEGLNADLVAALDLFPAGRRCADEAVGAEGVA